MDFNLPSDSKGFNRRSSKEYRRALAKKKASESLESSKRGNNNDLNSKLLRIQNAKKLRQIFIKIITGVKREQQLGLGQNIYENMLTPVPVTGEGDKITLPQSALNVLGDAIGTRVLTFSLSTANEEVLTAEGPDSSPSSLHSLLSSEEKSALLSSDALSSSLPSDSDSDSDSDSSSSVPSSSSDDDDDDDMEEEKPDPLRKPEPKPEPRPVPAPLALALKAQAKKKATGSTQLLGNVAVRGWSESSSDEEEEEERGGRRGALSEAVKKSREKAFELMETQKLARKRKLRKSNWDAKLDEGKRKKVKAKKVEGDDPASQNFGRKNPFFKKQAQHLRLAGAKGQGGEDAKRRKR